MSEAVTETDTSLNLANKTLQDYEVISVIGNGSFGTCFKVRDKETGKLYAWKGLDYDELSESQKESLVSEISVLRQLQHPNIVQYYHHLVNHEAKLIFIVMECCECDLAQLIASARIQRKRFEEKYIWRVLFQICKALQVCHNKIKQGTILHRDIKPANVFLDANGNAKLGDFGLARMLRRNENFAQSFVGTPYYMSPELVKGSKYDRKSDVWAVGCLTYELCALQPPFRGRQFNQLSANISNGLFSSIPDAYSSDLQAIIAFMLEVENYQRPSIEIISRHPTVVRNISELGNEFPKLIEAEDNFSNTTEKEDQARCKLQYNSLHSTTMFTEQNSFNEEYGQRCLSSDAFTPDLRAELFYSGKRRVFSRHTFQRSDPELYESVMRCKEYATADDETFKSIQPQVAFRKYSSIRPPPPPQTVPKKHEKSVALLTQNDFDTALQDRLYAIRAQECLLEQKAAFLNSRELHLNEKEKRLQELERNLYEKTMKFEREMKDKSLANVLPKEPIISLPPSSDHLPPPPPPPVPPRKSTKHDDTYCTIDDSLLQQPTMVKMTLPTFPSLRKVVTFQSPKKFIKYNIENVATKTMVHPKSNQTSSITSKGSDDSTESNTQRRKSIFSTIFGLHRNTNNKNTMKVSAATQAIVTTKERLPLATKNEQVLTKCETSELPNIWTKEHKRAAFDLLAAMNAAEQNVGINTQTFGNHHLPSAPTYKLRHSVRDRNTLHRNRMRRSLAVTPN